MGLRQSVNNNDSPSPKDVCQIEIRGGYGRFPTLECRQSITRNQPGRRHNHRVKMQLIQNLRNKIRFLRPTARQTTTPDTRQGRAVSSC